MCGIVGVVAVAGSAERNRDVVSAMAERIRHRGPDGGGVATHPDATLGMTRLAIVDVAHGHQPMSNDDESVVIVYNGEVYNAPALRRELEERGVRFRTRSDTEVILRLYERDPDRVEEHLAGMWAFAIHDRRRHRVVLSRDRFGIKPLFVADTGTALAFASELRCFDRNLPPFSGLFAIDHDAAHAMLSWSYVPESSTIYQGVRRLPPGTRLTIDLATGRRQARSYWTLSPAPDASHVRTMDEACEQVEALLRRSVTEHLESDVPIALFLSGGIDSSLVAAYAHEASATPTRAYTIGFRERDYDEAPFAREIAGQLGVPLTVEAFDEDMARDRLVDALLAHDEPFGDSSSLATYLLASQVGRDFKVALGGDGGDEVFAGYKRYMMTHLRKPFSSSPRLRNGIGRALAWLPAHYDRRRPWTNALRQFRLLSVGLEGTDAHAYTRLTQWVALADTKPLVRQAVAASRFEEEACARFERARGTELQRSLATDCGSLLCNDMLVKVDRASMACSLEVRVPFLDHRLVEFGVGLPAEFTVGPPRSTFRGKRVLRALYERRFGRALAERQKRGFSVPAQAWLEGPFAPACERLFAKKRLDRFGILSSDELSDGRFREWLARGHSSVVWHAFALAAWCEANLGDGPDALRDLIDGQRQPAVMPVAPLRAVQLAK